jgi:hypothetical protein
MKELRRLPEEDYSAVKLVTLVCDNLNMHDKVSSYFAYDAATAH